MAAADRLQVDKLTSDCWATWKFQITLYLDAHGLLGIIDGTEPMPPDGDAAATQAWQQREKQAIF